MPADPTTQVAPASDPADVGAAQEEQAQVSQREAAGANGETIPPEPDVKAEWEKTKAELAQERSLRQTAEKDRDDAKNLVRTQAGAQSANDRRLNRLEQQIQRQGEILKAGLTVPDAAGEIAKLEKNHQDEDQASFDSFLREQGRKNNAALLAVGLTDADLSNEELADGLALWRRSGNRADIEEASASLARGIKRIQAAKQAEKAAVATVPEPKPSPPGSNGAGRRVPNLDTGPGVGVGNISMETLVERYGADYESLSPDQRKRAEDYMRREGLI